MSELPQGWIAATGKELFDFVTSGSRGWAQYYSATGGVRFIRISNLQRRSIALDLADVQSVNLPSSVEGQRTRLRACDILISITAELGLIGLVGDDLGEAYVSQHIALVRPSFSEFAPYIARYLISPEGKISIGAANRGVTKAGLGLDDIRALPVPLPPLPEQRRIVATIDSLSGKSRRARDHLDHIPRLVERYKQAVLTAAFRPAGNDTEFMQLGDVIVSTFYGPRFARDAYNSEGVVTLRTTDFDDGGNIKPKSPPAVLVSEAEFTKWGLIDGDLLVTRTGSIGKCALYSQSIGPALPSAYLIRVRLKLERIRPRYALLFMLSGLGQRQLGLGVTAVTQPNINAGVIERLKLPVPDLHSQDDAIRRIETAFAWIDRLAAEATRARKLIDNLDQAVLATAFRGELVPQDPTDEPASVLLERIRVERETTAPSRSKARRS